MPKGYLSLMLHAHLPFVYHPDQENLLEERWLFEAITETYIPLVKVFEHLVKDDVPFRITMSLTPTLISMLQQPILQDRYIKHIDQLIELAQREIEGTGNAPHYHGLALMYHRLFKETKDIFVNRYKKNLVSAFRMFQDMGCLEIVTCAATHGFLPILMKNRKSVEAQVGIAVEHYHKMFGVQPKGIWLPECGYVPGIDEILKKFGVQYFFTDTHGIAHADPKPQHHVFAPIYCPSGVAAFGRDQESSRQVWSSKEGYPGDPDYREYYKDIGYEWDFDYIRDYIHPDGIRINTGIKYWRVTGKTEYKEAYRPDWAQEKAAQHAQDFLWKRQQQIGHLASSMDRKPIVVAPYDAELFGHWWYEGPMWLDYLIRKIVYDQKDVVLATPSDYLKEYSINQMCLPSISSWGYKGFGEYWLNDTNDWIYRHIDRAGRRMTELAELFSNQITNGHKTSVLRRALNQAARELLLAESSDWPFIMKTGTMVSYAQRRVKRHINCFNRLYRQILSDQIDSNWLKSLEHKDDIFCNIDCAKYYFDQHHKNLQNYTDRKLQSHAVQI